MNAGPRAIEALFAGELDIAYVGPSPAINGYVRSEGRALRIVAGACTGGAGLVVPRESGARTASDFVGKTLATPQVGNTQDVALRHWLLKNGQAWVERGGRVRVVPLPQPEQLALFARRKIDGVFTVEPWVTRLIEEGGGRLLVDEAELWPGGRYLTTVLLVATPFLEKHPEIVRAFVAEHLRLTAWIRDHREEALDIMEAEIRRETGVALSRKILENAFRRLEVSTDPLPEALFLAAQRARDMGYLTHLGSDLRGIYELRFLEEAGRKEARRFWDGGERTDGGAP